MRREWSLIWQKDEVIPLKPSLCTTRYFASEMQSNGNGFEAFDAA